MLISKLPNKYWKSYSIIVIQLRVYFYSAARVAVLGSGGRGLVEVCMGFGTAEWDCCGIGCADVNGPCILFLPGVQGGFVFVPFVLQWSGSLVLTPVWALTILSPFGLWREIWAGL